MAAPSAPPAPLPRCHFALLAELNADVEGGRPLARTAQQQLWHDWLWASAPDATLLEECGGMNAMHLRGLLLARALANDPPAAAADDDDEPLAVADLFPECDDVHVHDTPVAELSARQLRDTVEACQLHVRRLLDAHSHRDCRGALLHLFMRFGQLAGRASDERQMDDASCVTRIPSDDPAQTLFIFSCKALRTCVNVFLMLFRCVEISARAQPLRVCAHDNSAALKRGDPTPEVGERFVRLVHGMIKPFHVEASLDEFNVLQQLWFLAPAHRLVYRHNFAGMFNDISQVVYFHYPAYVRTAQVSVPEMGERAINALPCLLNIVPQLQVVHDDDAVLPFAAPAAATEWLWLMSASRIYLWDAQRRRLLASAGPSILDLAAYYLLCVHGLDFFGAKESTGAAAAEPHEDRVQRVKMSDFGHARLLAPRRDHL